MPIRPEGPGEPLTVVNDWLGREILRVKADCSVSYRPDASESVFHSAIVSLARQLVAARSTPTPEVVEPSTAAPSGDGPCLTMSPERKRTYVGAVQYALRELGVHHRDGDTNGMANLRCLRDWLAELPSLADAADRVLVGPLRCANCDFSTYEGEEWRIHLMNWPEHSIEGGPVEPH